MGGAWLLLDSCGREAVVALCREDAVWRSATLAGRTFSAGWSEAVRSLLAADRLSLSAVDFVGLVNGPGSFTGVRVGLAAAKGLCFGSGVPLVTVSRLAVLAAAARTDMAVIDAGRGEVYLRANGQERLVARSEVELMPGSEEVATDAGSQTLLTDAAAKLLWASWQRGERTGVANADANYVRGEGQLYAKGTTA